LLTGCKRETRTDVLLKLASLPRDAIEVVLRRRGIDPTSFPDVRAALASVGIPITAKEAVDYAFTPHGAPPSYSKGRFGDGSAPVYYSALTEETCEAEVRYHLSYASPSAFPRFYHVLECDFGGTVAILHGKEVDHQELVCKTDAGYPFCQAVAAAARKTDIHAFHTPSARHPGGTCTPVFYRTNLNNERSVAHVAFIPDGSGLRYERA
jgi:RES domain